MKETPESSVTASTGSDPAPELRGLARRFGFFAAGLSLLFFRPLFDLGRFAAREELYSHIFLVPVITFYLIWLRRHALPARASASPGFVLAFLLAGLGALGGYFFFVARFRGPAPGMNDYLSWTILSYLCFLVGLAVYVFGKERVAAVRFPVVFLIFIVPMPLSVTDGIEWFLQRGSAEAADLLFSVTGTPVFRTGQIFQLPGITLEVARECSGIRSSYVLFMTCLLADYLILRRPVSRAALALAVIPLGLARNALRILTIALLCIQGGPEMIESPLHTHGGPVFFAVSLLPLFLLLYLLRKAERKEPGRKA